MTNKIRTVHIKLPGQWSDGWLYKEHLILWSRTGEMFVAELAELSRKVRAVTSPTLAVAADYAIFRNDWKTSEQFKRLSTIPNLGQALFPEFATLDEPIEIRIDSLGISPIDSEGIPGFVLDTNLYANCIFVGSTEGLFESRFRPDDPKKGSPVVQRLDHEVATVNAKYSAVNVSAGEKGLLFSRVDVNEANWRSQRAGFKRTAELSFDNSFASYNLLNYINDSFPTFLRAETQDERRNDRSEFQENQVIGYKDQADIRGVTAAALEGPRRAKFLESQSLAYRDEGSHAAQVLGNSAGRLLIRWRENLQVVDISARKGKGITVRADSRYQALREADVLTSPVLKTYAIGSGFLVELLDEIRLITPRGSYLLVREPAARIRTFFHARRYQDVALAVGENGLSILGFVESDE
jgi:hypothetical protein